MQSKKYNLGLFIFHRDLRLFDNTALLKASDECNSILPLFIIDERQVSKNNPYRGDNFIQFMYESILDLINALEKENKSMLIEKGLSDKIIRKSIQDFKIEAVYSNHDYTPFSLKRDKEIKKTCASLKVPFIQTHDYLLNEPGKVLNTNNEPYTVFTPYHKKATQYPVRKPNPKKVINQLYSKTPKLNKEALKEWLPFKENKDIFAKGGRKQALIKLKNSKQIIKDYKNQKDFPHQHKTTELSPYIKMGCISPRETYWYIKNNSQETSSLLRQLYWRDFYTTIAWYFPRIFKESFRKKYNKIPWSKNKNNFQRWCTGNTGIPIVDAGMRELNKTGWMNNRIRMITASFLVKNLHINWRWGEKYFATKLIDYDPSVNNGNWQWVAGTGTDAAPYFRVINPWLQQKRFDNETYYIKNWIKELKEVPPKDIHNWENKNNNYKNTQYPPPIVSTKETRKEIISIFKKISQ